MSAFTSKDTNISAPLRWMLMERCLFVAGKIVQRSYTTMMLENQTAGITIDRLAEQIMYFAEKLYEEKPRYLWDDDDNGVEWEKFKKNLN